MVTPWQTSVRTKHLTVPFDIPSTDALFTAELRPTTDRKVTTADEAFVAVDQPLPMHLTITRSCQWDVVPGSSDTRVQFPEFYYELLANPDVWLVAGRRRASFSLQVSLRQLPHQPLIC